MYRATDIAKWFILKGIENKKPLTPMQVLKLTYITQGIHVALYNEALFTEGCQAWPYGPVVLSVYQKTKSYKSKPIDKDILKESKGIDEAGDHETLSLLQDIWATFKEWTGVELSSWSHRKGSAWDIAYNKENGKDYIGYDISADLLKEDFSNILRVKSCGREKRPNSGVL